MRLTLLGTGTPIPDIARRGPASLVEVGNERILVDAGAGVLYRLLEAGLTQGPRSDGQPHLSRILLTHLHSDHITGLADILWAGWIMNWWPTSPPIYGPPGTAEFVAGLETAFAYDLRVRRALDRRDRPWVTPAVTVVDAGWVQETPDVRISAFRVDHHPVDQAFGFRLDSDGGSIGFSGDTCPTDSLVTACQGVDVLVHEVFAAQATAAEPATGQPASRRRRGVASYHTGSHELGPIAAAADARHLVLNHMLLWGAPPEQVTADIERTYTGKLTAGQDLLSISL